MANGKDYITYQINGLWHWEGIGDYTDYCSEDGFKTELQAEKDAEGYLSAPDAIA